MIATQRRTRVGRRGHVGRHLGAHSYLELPVEYRGTTRQVAGLWPFAIGGDIPRMGVPLGHHLHTNSPICGDPITWFAQLRLMSNPSWFVLGIPGLGKSSLTRRIVLGLTGMATPLILGDLKPDYVDLIRAMDGQIIPLGHGRGSLNILDPGQMEAAASRLGKTGAATVLREESHGRRLGITRALLSIVRGRRTEDWEDVILSNALRILSQKWTRRKTPPVLRDLLDVIDGAPDELRNVVVDRGELARYREAVDPLLRSLIALCDGALGAMFARQTTQPFQLDSTSVCVDVSGISASDRQLQAAAMAAAWNEGFGAVEATNALADAGLEPQRHYITVLDELWRVLGAGEGLVDRVNELTRLNRSKATGQILITHSIKDLQALSQQRDIENARGFVERSGAVVCFGLPAQELDSLADIVPVTDEERHLITSWSAPPGWSAASTPPGQGNCVIKVGQRPGIPVHIDLLPSETGLHDTSKRWALQ